MHQARLCSDIQRVAGFAAVIVVAALLSPLSASGSTIVYQQVWNSGATDGGSFSRPEQELAGEFVLGAAATVDGAFWYGTMFSADPLNTGDTWNFDLVFYADAGNLPGAVLQTASVVASVVDTGIDIIDQDFGAERAYQFTATFSPLAFSAGASYWFSVLNTGLPDTFRWTEAIAGLDSALGSGGVWLPYGEPARTPLNFTLVNNQQAAVPEPASLLLLGTGLLGAASIRRWRQRKA